jgi:hypothetical protein
MIIGISGVARSGKDTLANGFVKILKELGVKSERLALADELRKECRSFIKRTLNIDVLNMTDDEKKIVRPFLVFWGTHMRRKADENCWIKALEKRRKPDSLTIVSDIRYQNEADWIKESGGFLIHIARLDDKGEFIQAPNEEERENDPLLIEKSNVSFVWNTFGSEDVKLLTDYCYAFFESSFSSEVIEQWQTTYPLSKKLKKTKTKSA